MSSANYAHCEGCERKAFYAGEEDIPEGVVIWHQACLDARDPAAVTPAAIAAARSVLWGIDGGTPPYMARVAEYVSIESTGALRAAEMARFRAADAEADELNDDLVRRALEAAAPFMRAAPAEGATP